LNLYYTVILIGEDINTLKIPDHCPWHFRWFCSAGLACCWCSAEWQISVYIFCS